MPANVQTMMYVGEKPWHGLGTKLDNPVTSEKAIIAAGLNWTVRKDPVYRNLNNDFEPIPRLAAITRDDNNVLGVVSDRYSPVQNIGAFDFFDAVVGEKLAMYHTAGALGKGEKIWLLAKIPDDLIIGRSDAVEKYLLLSNSHDGTSKIRMLMTPVRVVCNNTLSIALSKGAGEGVAITHVGDIKTKIEEAKRALGIAIKFYDDFASVAGVMYKKFLNKASINHYINSILPNPNADDNPTAYSTVVNRRLDILERIESPTNKSEGQSGTIWGAYNATVEHIDHRQDRRFRTQSNRMKSLIWGPDAALKRTAWDKAVALV